MKTKKLKYSLLSFLITLPLLIKSEISPDQMTLIEQLPPDQRANILEKMETASSLKEEIDEKFDLASSLTIKPELKDLEDSEDYCADCIYGFNFFKYSPTTFAPVDNTPVSSEYILGPGDKLIVNFFGSEDEEVEVFINREGKIILPFIGPINLIGKTFKQASTFLSKKVETELIGTEVDISLSEVRSIGIYILGEAYKPGRYVMSGLSSVSNALFVGGGVNEQGSLRTIQIIRNNKVISTYDFYDFLLKGSLKSDVILQDGDVIFVPFIENSVTLGGAFKRPYRYEIIAGETVRDAINLAGGFNSEVHGNPNVELSSIDSISATRVLSYLDLTKDLDRTLMNLDAINISSVSGLSSQTIKLSGEVRNPGEYSIQPGDKILDIIERAGGYTDQSYFQGAVFLRESVAESQKKAFDRSADELENTIVDVITKNTIDEEITEFTLLPVSKLISRLRSEEPMGRMVVSLDPLTLKKDPILNFSLQNGDSLYIPKRPSFVSIVGEVLNSATVGFDPNLSVKEYIDLAGGLNDTADRDKIFVILPNGKSQLVKERIFSSNKSIMPGSTIVISRDSRPFDAISLTQIITPILADLATSAAAIAAISD
jgi:protein involved in polysaccharide export with SLBB domain